MNNNYKLLIGGVIASIFIISSIFIAFSVLKDETINNYLTISKLNARTMSKEVNQDFVHIEQTIDNIVKNLDMHDTNVNEKLKDIQRYYPQIRSMNILIKNKIIYSSNNENIGIVLKELNLFPESLFNKDILKISTPWLGRDFSSAVDTYKLKKELKSNDSYFIPISKTVNTADGELNIVININTDYLMNRFLSNIDSKKVTFELVRLDGILLLSTDGNNLVGKNIVETELLSRTIEKNEITGVENIGNNKYIVTYILTDNYPLNLSVKLDYKENLLSWDEKQYNFFILTTGVIVLSILLALYFFYLFNKKNLEEIRLTKLQVSDQEKFRLLFQDSHFMSVIMDSSGSIIDINNLALKFLNKEIEEIKGLKLWDLECWYSKESKFLKEKFLNSSSSKKIVSEIKAKSFLEKDSVIEFNLSTIKTEDDYNYIVIGLDITERKEKEEKLIQSYTVFNNTRDGIIITDKKCNIIEVNNAFERITGFSKKDISNKNINILRSGLHELSFYENMWDSIDKNGYWEGEITSLKKNKEYFTEWLTINAIYDDNSEVLHFIGIFSDISEQKRKDELLKEKEKLIHQQSKMASMGEMLENIAHQWRQPLSVISTAATGIKMQKELGILSDEDEITSLNKINESSQYLSNTIDDFRRYLNSEQNYESFSVKDSIDYTLKLVSSKLDNRDIKIIKDYDDFEIWGIKNEFVQVLLNIISNAKDSLENSSSSEKYIFISCEVYNDQINIIIKDNGGGIPIDLIEKIFDPYFTTKHKSQGTGIGLYMSAEIIRNHMKGHIFAENEAYEYNGTKHIGASFKIILSM